MALSTFGAIMGFAAGMAGQARMTYEALIEKARDPRLRETLKALAGKEGKISDLMEKTRREHVTEMILEPVAGLHEDDYGIDLDGLADLAPLLTALALEERERRFFQDASEKLPLPEVARIFRKIVREKEENLKRLRGIERDQL